MRIIIAPAKKMKEEGDLMEAKEFPVFLDQAESLRQWICSLSYEQAKKLWNCSDKIAAEAYERFCTMDLKCAVTPAVLAYDGIQYRYLAAHVMEEQSLCYLQKHLRILSGFYGILRPMDGIVPYRLEMQAKTQNFGHVSLYAYWGEKLYRNIAEETDCILNLASKEYAACIEPYLDKKMEFLTCIFGELKGSKVVQKATEAKMARGEMVRYLAENKIEDLKQIKMFEQLGYQYDKKRSSENIYIFLKNKK